MKVLLIIVAVFLVVGGSVWAFMNGTFTGQPLMAQTAASATPTATSTPTQQVQAAPAVNTATPTPTNTPTTAPAANTATPTPTNTPAPAVDTATPTPTRTPTPSTPPPAGAGQVSPDLIQTAVAIVRTEVAKSAPPAIASPSTSPAASTTPGTNPSTTGAWTRAQKCAWLQSNFPQSTDTVQALGAKLAGVEPQRISASSYPCDAAGNGVFDGFVVLGPKEGFRGLVTLTVPDGGRIDSYPVSCGAQYSQTPRMEAGGKPNPCDDTWSADAGTVTAQRMSYWPWNDKYPPIGRTTVAQASMTPGTAVSTTVPPAPSVTPAPTYYCVTPEALAKEKGWEIKEWADKRVGGLRVYLSKASTLPEGWEAQTSGQSIGATDTDRTMVSGYWTIYCPKGQCRAFMGFADN